MKHTLIANRWRTPDGTILWSKHRHDYVSHDDKNGEFYFVDGGNDYVRMTQNKEPMVSECVYADDDFSKVREVMFRGTFAKDVETGEMMRAWVPISRMSDAHLCNCILDNIKAEGSLDRYEVNTHMYVKELLYRYSKGISMPDHKYLYDEFSKGPEYNKRRLVDGIEGTNMDTEFFKDELVGYLMRFSQDSDNDAVWSQSYIVFKSLDNMFEKLSEKEDENALLG